VKKAVLAVLIIICMMLSSVSAVAAGADPYYPAQKNLERIGFSSVWENGLDGRGVRVAIIDSGIYTEHEELADANILHGLNVIDRSVSTADSSGHGTFIAGMLAASRNNGIGISGMVDKATILPLKCFSHDRQSNARYIVSAIYMAVDEYNCDVINLSLGITDDIPSLRKAVEYAAGKGVLLVAAVGNNGGTAKVYPASYDDVVGVGSVGSNGKSSYFSQRNKSVFVVAPGEDIISLGKSAKDSYMVGSGTSYSTAHITALAAAAKQYNKGIDNEAFMQLLKDSAEDLGDEGYDTTYGWGLVDAGEFVRLLLLSNKQFTDVDNHWAKEHINQSVKKGLFSGVSDELFMPDEGMTRAMAATVLYRLAGSPSVVGGSPFTDVAEGEWYTPAVIWANEQGIIQGDGNGSFLPENFISRQELATIIFRYAAHLNDAVSASKDAVFPDYDEIAEWAQKPVSWCAYNGLIGGRTDGRFDPNDIASRAEVAAIMMRFVQNIVV